MAQGPQNYTALVTTLDGQQSVVNIKILSAASPPERPTGPGDQPPPGGSGNYPSHPIFYPPGTGPGYPGWGGDRPHPEFPISGPPWFPGEPPVTPPGGGAPPALKPPSGDQPGLAAMKNSAATGEAPPAEMPAGSSKMDVYFGAGTLPTFAWVGPYVATHP
jgi:hypothetical protein